MTETTRSGPMQWLREDLRRFDLLVALTVAAVGIALALISPGDFDSGWPEVVGGVGAFVLLILRRHAPLPLLAGALVWVAAHVAIWQRPTPMVFATMVLLASAAVRVKRRTAIGLGLFVGFGAYLSGLLINEVNAVDERALIGIVWAGFAVGIGDATRTWRRYTASAQAELHSARLAADAQARAQVNHERLTIARELHDLLAHNLSVMNVQTGAALHLLRSNPDAAEESLTQARDAGKSVIGELGDLLAVLRHEGTDAPTTSLPSVDELDQLVETLRSSGMTIEWTQSGNPPPLSPVVSLAAYRITQESLTNAAKHGHGPVHLTTDWATDGLKIQVRNAVAKQSGGGSGQGLVGMNERAELNGGRLDARTVGGEFVVDAWLPSASETSQ